MFCPPFFQIFLKKGFLSVDTSSLVPRNGIICFVCFPCHRLFWTFFDDGGLSAKVKQEIAWKGIIDFFCNLLICFKPIQNIHIQETCCPQKKNESKKSAYTRNCACCKNPDSYWWKRLRPQHPSRIKISLRIRKWLQKCYVFARIGIFARPKNLWGAHERGSWYTLEVSKRSSLEKKLLSTTSTRKNVPERKLIMLFYGEPFGLVSAWAWLPPRRHPPLPAFWLDGNLTFWL